jgi:CHAD domain-containing protein
MSTTQASPASIMGNARRQLIEQTAAAIHTSTASSLDDQPVHELRKQMKRIRAGLRLLHDALGATTYQRLNRSVRNAARPLTPIRDAKILRDTLDSISQPSGKSAQNGALSNWRQALQKEYHSSRIKLSKKALGAIETRLKKVAQVLASLPASRLDSALTKATLKRPYKKAYQAFRVAKQEPSDENLHEWRKQVKYHFHQLEFIQSLKPKRIATTIKQAHRISDFLGDDHDLALLHEKLTAPSQRRVSSPPTGSDELIKQLQRRRAKFQRKAQQLGKKLYAHKPKKIAKQLSKHMNGKVAHPAPSHGA